MKLSPTHGAQITNRPGRLGRRCFLLCVLWLGLVAGAQPPARAFATTGVVLKIFHAAPGNGAFDIYLDALPAAVGTLNVGQFTGAFEVNPGTHQIRVFPTGNTSTPTLVLTTNLARGKSYTVVLAGSAGNVQPLVLVDPPTAPYGYFRYRLVNLAPGSPPIELINSSNRVVISGVSFTSNKYVTLRSGLRYNFAVRLQGQPTPFQTLPEFIGQSRKSYTVWVLSTQISAALAGGQAPSGSAAAPAPTAEGAVPAGGGVIFEAPQQLIVTQDSP